MCASMARQGTVFGAGAGLNMGNEQPVAVLWGGREFNPSSIRVRYHISLVCSIEFHILFFLVLFKSIG